MKKLGEVTRDELIWLLNYHNCDNYGLDYDTADKSQLMMCLFFNGVTSCKVDPDEFIDRVAAHVKGGR